MNKTTREQATQPGIVEENDELRERICRILAGLPEAEVKTEAKGTENGEAGVKSPPSHKLECAAGISIENITTVRSKVTREGIASANSKPKFQKSQLTKTKEGKGRGQALKGKDQEEPEDEYDLPRSPEQQIQMEDEELFDKAKGESVSMRVLIGFAWSLM